jgi:hypothetical protein
VFDQAATAIPGGDQGVSPTRLPEQDKQDLANIAAAFSAPISLFGKVVDQNGVPVEGAKVFYSAAVEYFGKSSTYTGVSDSSGSFSITGIKGAGVYVEVSKDGYDRIPDKSYANFGYGVPSGRRPPSSSDPALFILRKKARADSLIAVDTDVAIPKNGTPVDISLQTGKAVPRGRGDLTVELWANDQEKDNERRYDWGFRVSVPGGGIMKRDPESMEFEAPGDGYEGIVEHTTSRGLTRWRDRFDDEYFVKLGNGTFARMHFRITTGGGHFASITSYLNPTPGSRNLEFDPNKQIAPQP